MPSPVQVFYICRLLSVFFFGMSPQLCFPTPSEGPASCRISWLPRLKSWKESLLSTQVDTHWPFTSVSRPFHLLASPPPAASNPVLLRIQCLVTSGHGLFESRFWLVFHPGTSDPESLWFGDGSIGVRSTESHLQGPEFQPWSC